MDDFEASNGLRIRHVREEHLMILDASGLSHWISGNVLDAVREYVKQEQS